MRSAHPGHAALAAALAAVFVCSLAARASAGCPDIPMPETPPTFLHEWGSLGSGSGQFNSPYGVAVDGDLNVWVVDLWNNRVQKFSPEGTFLQSFHGAGSADNQLFRPAQLAFDADGNWYVTVRHAVEMYDPAGNFIREWGSGGSGESQFGIPDGIGVGPQGHVYVVDHDNSRVQKFSAIGEYIMQWSHADMFHPHGLAITDDGAVYISGGGTSKVLKFDLDGNHLLTLGIFGNITNCAEGGEFNHTVGLAVAPAGELYVVDSFNARVQKFNALESFLCLWGEQGAGEAQFGLNPGSEGAGHVAVASDGTIYVTDTVNDRVQAFFPSTTNAVEPWASSWGRLKASFRDPQPTSP